MSEHLDITESILIDRLVDGELSADARRQAIVALDAHPEGWRRCALAFLEAQTWRQELRRVATDASAVAQQEILKQPAAQVASQEHCHTAASTFTKRRAFASLAAAAMLLVAFGLGRHLGSDGSRQIVDRPTEGEQLVQSAHVAGPNASDATETDPNSVTLVVNDRMGASHRLSVPLVEAAQMGAEFSDTPHWSSPELNRRLDAQGFGLAARRRYVPLYFEQQDQRVPFVVPVDDAVVTPVSRPLY